MRSSRSYVTPGISSLAAAAGPQNAAAREATSAATTPVTALGFPFTPKPPNQMPLRVTTPESSSLQTLYRDRHAGIRAQSADAAGSQPASSAAQAASTTLLC